MYPMNAIVVSFSSQLRQRLPHNEHGLVGFLAVEYQNHDYAVQNMRGQGCSGKNV